MCKLQYLLIQSMGNQQQKQVHKPSLEDSIIEMKLQSKALGRAAKKAEKEAIGYQKKAKDVLKKNNEQAAKMYLMNAAAKTKQAQNCERTAMRMEFMCGQIKSMKNNETYVNAFSALTQAASQQMGNFDAATMANQMEIFNNKMDEMMINGKMVTEIMSTNEPQTDGMVEQMKEALQQEIALEEKNKLVEQEKKEIQKYVAENDKFLDELKGL